MMNFRIPIVLSFFFAIATVNAQISFTSANELLEKAGIHSGVGMAISDMNGDFKDDIVRLDNARNLYIDYQANKGLAYKGEDIIQMSGFGQWTITLGDIDNNGLNDVLSAGNHDGIFVAYNMDGTVGGFERIVQDAPSIFAQSSNLSDIDNDGLLDIFVCNDIGFSNFLMNNGSQMLVHDDDIMDFPGNTSEDASGNYGSIWTDFDSDGDIDLYIAKCRQGVNDPEDPRRINQLWMNNGDGTYTEAADSFNLKIGWQSWSADFGDMDNDGDMDCFITNHDYTYQLLRNDGDSTFVDISDGSGIQKSDLAIQGLWVDMDNDGLLDILVAGNTHHIFHNNGDYTFSEIGAGIDAEQVKSCAIGDVNDDGFIDFIASYENLFNQPTNKDDKLWLNDGNDNNWVTFSLVGDSSNRSGIGSKVEIYGPWGVQCREIHGGLSYGIHNSVNANFGLGSHESIDSVIIRWPSGLIDRPIITEVNTHYIQYENACLTVSQDLEIMGVPVLCPGDSITLMAPLGSSYLWNNGDTSQQLIIKEAGLYTVKVEVADDCYAPTYTFYAKASALPQAEISIDGAQTNCEGDEVVLMANESIAYEWEDGSTASSFTAIESGTYHLTITGFCSLQSTDSIELTFLEAIEPIVEPDSINVGEVAVLKAIGDSVIWYNAEMDQILGYGDSLKTDTLTSSQIYFAESVSAYEADTAAAGMIEQIGSNLYSGNFFNGIMEIEVYESFTWISSMMETDKPGIREVQVFNSDFELYYNDTSYYEMGMYRKTFNVDFEPGTYYITTNEDINFNEFNHGSPRFTRSNQGVDYPYVYSDVFEVVNSDAGADYYYYFFDWEVKEVSLYCHSDKVEVEAYVHEPSSNQILNERLTQISPNPSTGLLKIELMKGFDHKSLTIKCFNINGQAVYQRLDNHLSDVMTIDLSSLSKGIYFIELSNENYKQVEKIILH